MTRSIVLLALATMLGSSALAGAEITNLSCDSTAPAEYKLSFSLTGESHQVEISASPDPSGDHDLAPILKTSELTVIVHAGKPGQRMYFFLKPDHGAMREVSIRRLPLEGTPNFRDLGGYETKDGRFVRWGLIYRSGVLSYLTPTDFQYLGQLGVRVVCDFRTQQENTVAPELWIPAAQVDHITLPIGADKSNTNATLDSKLAANPSVDQLKAMMSKTYNDFAFRAAPQYSTVFVQLEKDALPLLYHCTAGKDRTGVFSALLLLTLGVPEQTVLNDYSLTTAYLLAAEGTEVNRKMLATSGSALANLPPEKRQVLMAADPEYLRTTLRAIDARYGSFDEYRRKALNVSDADVEKLKTRLLMR